MTFKRSLLAAFLGVGLSACGGGNSSGTVQPETWYPYVYVGPTVVTKTDTVMGTGAEAVPGKRVTVLRTQWHYSATAPDFKGEPFTGQVPAPSYAFTLVISAAPGLADAVLGMRVGGKRTAVIPGDMSPGSPPAGPGAPAPVPRLAPSVAEIELIEVI